MLFIKLFVVTCQRLVPKFSSTWWDKPQDGSGGHLVGTKVTHFCHIEGKGHRNIHQKCQSNGRWSGSLPKCCNY